MSDVKWNRLKLQTLVRATREVHGYEVQAKTLGDAYEEVLRHLQSRELELDYACAECGADLDEASTRCWACGASFDEDSEPEMAAAEVRRRARSLGIEDEALGDEALRVAVEDAESKRASIPRRSADVAQAEFQQLNERLTELMPDGWTKHPVRNFVSYWDALNVKRIVVKRRGLHVFFAVEDGQLDGTPNLAFLDQEERRRRHFGRDNYLYVGDVTKEVLSVCQKVFDLYA